MSSQPTYGLSLFLYKNEDDAGRVNAVEVDASVKGVIKNHISSSLTSVLTFLNECKGEKQWQRDKRPGFVDPSLSQAHETTGPLILSHNFM